MRYAWLLLLGLLFGCRPHPSYPQVRLHVVEGAPVVNAERAPGKLPLRVAVAAVISPRATFDTYGPLLDYLGVPPGSSGGVVATPDLRGDQRTGAHRAG